LKHASTSVDGVLYAYIVQGQDGADGVDGANGDPVSSRTIKQETM